MIPKQIFSAWIGPEMPAQYRQFCEDAKKMNLGSGWKYNLLGNEVLERYKDDPYVRRLNGMCVPIAFIVDRIRLLLLRDEGGWWFDPDCKFIRPAARLNRLCDDDRIDFVTGVRNPWRPHVHPVRGVALVDNTIFGTAKGGRTVNRMLSLYTAQEPKQTGLLMGANLLATCDESVVFLNYRYFYSDEEDRFPETVVTHDMHNCGSWSKPPQTMDELRTIQPLAKTFGE